MVPGFACSGMHGAGSAKALDAEKAGLGGDRLMAPSQAGLFCERLPCFGLVFKGHFAPIWQKNP